MAARSRSSTTPFLDFFFAILERGITFSEGGRSLTISLGKEGAASRSRVGTAKAPARRKPGRPRGSTTKKTTDAARKGGPGRPKGSTTARKAKKAPRAAAQKAPRGRPKKAKPPAPALPATRDVLLFLDDNKATGSKLTQIGKHFGLKRPWMKKLMDRLEKEGAVYIFQNAYFAAKKLRRGRDRRAAPRASTTPRKTPIPRETILEILRADKSAKGLDRKQIADKLSINYQRLIQPMNSMADEGLIKRTDASHFTAA